MNRPVTLLMPLLAAAWLSGCATTPPPASIAETTARNPELSTLNRLIADAGLGDTLRGSGPFTVFAPTDAAFKALPTKTLDELSKDKARLKAVLTYHVLPAKVMASDVRNSNVKTVNGGEVAVSKAGAYVTFDDALVTQADIGATNGVVHLIDKVILPPARR